MDPEETDLRDDIGAALDEQLGAEPPPEKQAQEDDPFPRADDMPKSGREYVREGRRFVPKEQEQPAAEAQPQPAAPKEWAPLWYKPDQHKVEWAKLAPEFRQALEQREKEFAQGIEKHATPAKNWGAVEEHFAPFKAQIEQGGGSVAGIVDGLVNDYKSLALGDVNTKLATFDRLCATFFGGRSLEQLAYELQQQGYQPAPQPSPEVIELRRELAQLKQGFNGIQSSAKEQQQAALQAEIQEFAKDKPDFDLLKKRMSALMQAGEAATLQDAYEQARWAHPETRKRSLEAQRKADVERARAAAQSPRGGPNMNGALRNAPKRSLRDDIAEQVDEMLGG